MHTIIFLAFFLLQIRPEESCSFIRISGEFMAAVKFSIRVESKESCLAACFDELDCTFVEYSEGTCTVFTDGNTNKMSNGSVLKFERDVPRPTCGESVEFGIPVEFQPIAVDKTRNAACSGLPTATTVIHGFIDSSRYRFYAKQGENFFNELRRGAVLTFAREFQPHCTSIPVFARAGRRRLFFGSVYNTTGYTFMDAYAFASKCACNGACCGKEEIKERYAFNRSYIYSNYEGNPLTLGEQSFFIAGY